MAKGNRIIVSADWQGKLQEFTIGAGLTVYPGTVVQRDHSIDLVGGRFTAVLYNADADGAHPKGPMIVVIEDYLSGKSSTTAYAAGERALGYCPEAGDELNLLVLNLSGTADDHSAGEILIVDDTTGKFIATTGTPEEEVAQLNEDITDPTADTLAWCTWQR